MCVRDTTETTTKITPRVEIRIAITVVTTNTTGLALQHPFPRRNVRARHQVRRRGDTVTDAAAAAQHTAVTVARRRGGARDVAAAGDGAVTDHHHSTQRSRESAIFQLTVTRLRGWRRRRATVAGAVRARGALVGSVLAAATCSPSGGGGSGGASYTRHRGRYVVRAVDLDPAVVRIFDRGLCFSRALAPRAQCTKQNKKVINPTKLRHYTSQNITTCPHS